jgi:hypothetical protein
MPRSVTKLCPLSSRWGLFLFLGEDKLLYMRVNHGRAARVRSWGGHDPDPLKFERDGGRRIPLPIQGYHCSSSSVEYRESASGVLKIQSETINPLNPALNQLFIEKFEQVRLVTPFFSVSAGFSRDYRKKRHTELQFQKEATRPLNF